MSINLSVKFNTPKDLAIELLNNSDTDLLFLSETVEWVDHFACSEEFTVRALDYLALRGLDLDVLMSPSMTKTQHKVFLSNLYLLGIKAGQILNNLENKENRVFS